MAELVLRRKPTSIERFWAKVDKSGECWLWTGCLNRDGYGHISDGSLAHRFSYEIHVGPIPDGLTIDHLCRSRACVNPDHLEPVTLRTNILRGTSPSAVNAVKTHCKNGHPFDSANTRILPEGWRRCRLCERDRSRKYAAKNDV